MIFTTFELSTGATIEVLVITPILVSRMHQRQQDYNKQHPEDTLDMCPFMIMTICTIDHRTILLEDFETMTMDDYILINESINAQTNSLKNYL